MHMFAKYTGINISALVKKFNRDQSEVIEFFFLTKNASQLTKGNLLKKFQRVDVTGRIYIITMIVDFV